MAKKKPSKQQEKKELKVDKRPLDDLPLKEKETEDVKAGRAPPYVPVKSDM